MKHYYLIYILLCVLAVENLHSQTYRWDSTDYLIPYHIKDSSRQYYSKQYSLPDWLNLPNAREINAVYTYNSKLQIWEWVSQHLPKDNAWKKTITTNGKSLMEVYYNAPYLIFEDFSYNKLSYKIDSIDSLKIKNHYQPTKI